MRMILPVDFRSDPEKEERRGRIDLILISIAAGVVVSSFISGGIVLLTRWKKQGKNIYHWCSVRVLKNLL